MSELLKGTETNFMSYEQLLEIIADIHLQKNQNTKAVLTLLKVVLAKDIDLSAIEKAKAEKFVRELSSLQPTFFARTKTSSDYSAIRELCKEIQQKWAQMRREQLL